MVEHCRGITRGEPDAVEVARPVRRAPRFDPYSKLKGAVTWTYFYLYVILDVFSRYVVDWMVAERESSQSPNPKWTNWADPDTLNRP